MAASNFPAWFIALVFLLVSAVFSSAQGSNGTQLCADGTYEHDGRTCCKCAAGLYVKKHCTTSINRECDACDTGRYISYPNNQESCELCTSCEQPNANLEVAEACTAARDAKCRCKKDHYCSSGTETCLICYPCKVCDEGIKEACTPNSDTVCKDKTEGGNQIGIAVGVSVAIVSLIGLALFAFFWRRKQNRERQKELDQQRSGTTADVEMQPLRDDLDIQPHLPDLADVIGWKDMKAVAVRSGILMSIIDTVQENHPKDGHERTLELLMEFVQRNGKKASNNLIQILETSGKRDTAERVTHILSRATLSA